jgi:hypothetical protein
MVANWLTVGLASAVLFACGGGGGGIIGGNWVFFRVELPGRDAENLTVGETVTFELAGYDESNNRTKLAANSWALTNVVGSPGTIGSGGTFNATGTGTATVTATFQNKTVQSLDIEVHPIQAKITGNVRSTGGNPIAGAKVAFFDAGNQQVGRATTNSNGVFTASVPTSAVKMNLITIPPGWYVEWGYQSKTYSMTVPNCHATIQVSPPLDIGITSTLQGNITLTSTQGPPPPPPNGCN